MNVHSLKDELLSKIESTLTVLDEIQILSNRLDGINFDSGYEDDENEDSENNDDEIAEAIGILNQILNLCDEARQSLETGQQHSGTIVDTLGTNLSLTKTSSSSAIDPNGSLKIQSTQDFSGDLSSGQSELSSLISENPSLFPIVNLLAFIGADGSLIYNSDVEQRLSDLTHNPASNYYNKPPKKKMLGDLGEINVLKMLVDPIGQDRLGEQEINEIQIKASLRSLISNRNPEPDFYVPSRRLVIDAKAWKSLSISNLNEVIQKYVNLECVQQGGEVRLYFPSDVYEQKKTLLSKLPKPVNNVKVRIAPMEITYAELDSQRKIMLMYLRTLILPNQSTIQSLNRL